MKKTLRLLILSSILLLSTDAKEINTVTEVINIAGKQRMLTQRMLADYAMMGMHSTFKNPKEDLSKIIAEFDENQQAIKKYNKSDAVKKEIQDLENLWPAVKQALGKKPTLEICKTLCNNLDILLAHADQVVQSIKREHQSQAGEIVDISGRQRMLSQRIAGLYILNMWAVNNNEYKKKLDDAMALFKSSMEILKKYDKDTDEIKGLIGKVEKNYKYLEKMRSLDLSMNTMPSLVYQKLDGMLKNMHKVTGLYASIK